MRCHRQVPSSARRRRARPRSEGTADREDPARGAGRAPAGRNLLPGKRPTCRVCYTPPASAATASGDVAVGHRGRIADMTTLMLPADLAAVSSLPLVDQRATSSLATMRCGSMASSSQPGGAEQPILVPLLSCPPCAQVVLPAMLRQARDSCPRQGEALSLAVSCRWRQSQRGGSPAGGTEPGQSPASAAAGRRGWCQRGQPGKRAL
jgi:hypothetical protein